MGFVVTLYSALMGRMGKELLVRASIAFLFFSMLIFWWLFHLDLSWLPAAFYIWTSIYSALLVSQFWTMANQVFSPPQAKRLFGLIGSGGILGGIAGGSITSAVVNVVGTENLLLICCGLLVVIFLIVNRIQRKIVDGEIRFPDAMQMAVQKKQATKEFNVLEKEETVSGKSSLQLILGSRHLQLIALILGLNVMVSTLIDYEFNLVAEAAYDTKEEMAVFFGTFFAFLNLASLSIQLFLSSIILRRAGIGISLLILPMGLLLGSFGVIAQAALWSVVFVKLVDGSLRYSLDNSTREIVYFPLAADVRYKVKPFIDMFVHRLARGFSGLLILISTSVIAISISQLAALSLVLIFLWLIVAMAVQKEYLNSLRKLLMTRRFPTEENIIPVLDASAKKTIIEQLKSADGKVVSYALSMLAMAPDKSMTPHLTPLLSHEMQEVRQAALDLLTLIGDSSVVKEVEELITDINYDVASRAIFFVCSHSGGDPQTRMQSYLENSDVRMQCAAIVGLANHTQSNETADIIQHIERLMAINGDRQEITRLELARCLSAVPEPSDLHKYLIKLMDDKSLKVRLAAVKVAGKVADRTLIPHLITALLDRKTRAQARRALLQYGEAILETLAEYLGDKRVELEKRESIARVVGRIPKDRAVQILLDSLTDESDSLRNNVLKSINKLHRRHPELKYDIKPIRKVIRKEVRHYYELLRIKADHVRILGKGCTDDPLSQTIHCRLDQTLERIFRLLSLQYDPGDMYQAYYAVTHGNKAFKANAYELLDNILDNEIKKIILPVVDMLPEQQKVDYGWQFYGITSKSRLEYLKVLYEQPDIWMKASVLYTIGQGKLQALNQLVRNSIRSTNSVVREVAEYALAELKAT